MHVSRYWPGNFNEAVFAEITNIVLGLIYANLAPSRVAARKFSVFFDCSSGRNVFLHVIQGITPEGFTSSHVIWFRYRQRQKEKMLRDWLSPQNSCISLTIASILAFMHGCPADHVLRWRQGTGCLCLNMSSNQLVKVFNEKYWVDRSAGVGSLSRCSNHSLVTEIGWPATDTISHVLVQRSFLSWKSSWRFHFWRESGTDSPMDIRVPVSIRFDIESDSNSII
jgi:hypothetical protein